LYKKKEIELILRIKHLLHNEKFTLKGAKQHLNQRKNVKQVKIHNSDLDEIRTELKNIRDMLE